MLCTYHAPMTYTFWHSGLLIGESDLEQASGNPGQRGGVFRPTAYGLQIFPRLTGILSAGYALKLDLESQGVSEEALERGDFQEQFEASPAGAKILDIGRMLSEIEIRTSEGRRVEFTSIAFSDPSEIERLFREMGLGSSDHLKDLPPEAPRYIVSATLRRGAPGFARQGSVGRVRPRDRSEYH
jgi:hypothetical protein